MPLRLNIGLSKKVGLPDYGSVGASCSLEIDLAGEVLHQPALQQHARRAYEACSQAIEDELARQTASANGHAARSTASNGSNGHANSSATNKRATSTPARKATQSQVRALQTIARRQGLDLAQLLRERHGLARPEDLSLPQASQLIEELTGLKANGTSSGGRR